LERLPVQSTDYQVARQAAGLIVAREHHVQRLSRPPHGTAGCSRARASLTGGDQYPVVSGLDEIENSGRWVLTAGLLPELTLDTIASGCYTIVGSLVRSGQTILLPFATAWQRFDPASSKT
jgi:hypothetical protein